MKRRWFVLGVVGSVLMLFNKVLGCVHRTTKTLVIEGKNIEIDACIVDLVEALNRIGWKTISSCCGHETSDGYIWCEKRLIILSKETSLEEVKKRYFREFNDMAESNEHRRK